MEGGALREGMCPWPGAQASGKGRGSWPGGGAWAGRRGQGRLTGGHQQPAAQGEGRAQQRPCLREAAAGVAHRQVDQQLGGQLHGPEQQLRLIHVQPQPRQVQAQAVIGKVHAKPEGSQCLPLRALLPWPLRELGL